MVFAQHVAVPEPQFVHSYIHLTSDSTYNILPKEQGEFKKHESKLSKFARIGGTIANAAGSIGLSAAGLGAVTGSVSTVSAGVNAANGAINIASTVGTLEALGGMVGMDIVFEGKESEYTISQGESFRFIVKEVDNHTDPFNLMRIVRFNKGKKDRKIRWMNISTSLLGSHDADKNGYLNFSGEKYGETSYLITVSGNELKPGEYGIIIGNAAVSTAIPVATFSVK